MPRAPRFPRYPAKKHTSGQARLAVSGVSYYLGVFQSPASYVEYERLYREWRLGRLAPRKRQDAPRSLTVGDLIAKFFAAAAGEIYPSDGGEERRELYQFRFSLEPLAETFGVTPAVDFLAPQLKQVVRFMVTGDWMPEARRAKARERGKGRGWGRSTVNAALGRIKRLFAWAESEGLVPEGRAHHLQTARGLTAGQLGARETDDVGPAPEADIAAALPHCNPVVRAVLELLLLTAARPKEIRLLRPRDINTEGLVEVAKGYWLDLGGKVWAVRLRKHKTAHKRQRRYILFGPKAQAILRPFLDGRDPDAYLFSPKEGEAARLAGLRARRKTPVYPSEACRRKAKPKWAPGEFYSRDALHRAVRQACDRAGVSRFAPYSLRHNAASRLVAEHNWELARIILGHTSEEMTRRYAIGDIQKAAEAQGEFG